MYISFYILHKSYNIFEHKYVFNKLEQELNWESGSFDVVKIIYSDDSWCYAIDLPTDYTDISVLHLELDNIFFPNGDQS